MPKYKVFVKLPWPGSTQRVGRNIIIEAPNSMTATLQARGQYGVENVIGGGVEIPEPKSSNNSPKPTYTTSSGKSAGEHSFKGREDELIKRVISLYEEKFGKNEFKKLIGKDPKKLTYKEAIAFSQREQNKKSLVGKFKNYLEDDEKYRKEKGVVAWLTKDVRAVGSFLKKKLKKK